MMLSSVSKVGALEWRSNWAVSMRNWVRDIVIPGLEMSTAVKFSKNYNILVLVLPTKYISLPFLPKYAAAKYVNSQCHDRPCRKLLTRGPDQWCELESFRKFPWKVSGNFLPEVCLLLASKVSGKVPWKISGNFPKNVGNRKLLHHWGDHKITSEMSTNWILSTHIN